MGIGRYHIVVVVVVYLSSLLLKADLALLAGWLASSELGLTLKEYKERQEWVHARASELASCGDYIQLDLKDGRSDGSNLGNVRI